MSAEQKEKRTRNTSKKKSAAAKHLLTGDLTLQTAAAVKELFDKAVSAKGDVTFRLDNVGDVDLSNNPDKR